jgi:hypothetical protein
MLWLIVPKNAEKKDNEALQASADRLGGNPDLADEVATSIVSTSKDEVLAPVTPSGEEPKALHIVAHAGLDEGGHIGGLALADFGDALVTKFGTWLSGAEVWLHVCYIGQVLPELAGAVKVADTANSITGMSVYAPMNLMIVSRAGIPHVHGDAAAKAETVDPIVAKWNCDYAALRQKAKQNFLSTGEGWAGCLLAGGTVTPIAAGKVSKTVLQTFDDSQMEVGEGM